MFLMEAVAINLAKIHFGLDTTLSLTTYSFTKTIGPPIVNNKTLLRPSRTFVCFPNSNFPIGIWKKKKKKSRDSQLDWKWSSHWWHIDLPIYNNNWTPYSHQEAMKRPWEVLGVSFVKNFEKLSEIGNQPQCAQNVGKHPPIWSGLQHNVFTNLMVTL